MKTKIFAVAIAIVIGLGFLPAAREMREYFSQTQAAKYELIPLVTQDELIVELENTVTQYQKVKTPDEFFLGVAQQQRVEGLLEKFESVNGFLVADRMSSDVYKRRLNGAMQFASQNLEAQHGIHAMVAARQNHEAILEPIGSNFVASTQTIWFAVYGFGWSAFVMFLVFAFRAENFMHLSYELLSGRLLFASLAWPFFAAEYMKVNSNDYRSVAAMAKFAAVNLSILLSAVLSAGLVNAQTGTKKTKNGKRTNMVIVDASAEAADGKNPESVLAVSTKKNGLFFESATIVNEKSTTQFAIAGKEVFNNSGVSIDAYGGWRGDFRKNQPNAQRVFSGIRLFGSKKLDKDYTFTVSVPFAQFEQYVKPKLKSALFSTGQVFVRYKSKLRFGGEYTLRKEQGSKPFVAGGPFAGYNIFSNTRVEGLLQLSNSGPPRFRLRTVFIF